MREFMIRCENNKLTLEGEIVHCKDCEYKDSCETMKLLDALPSEDPKPPMLNNDCISRQAAIDAVEKAVFKGVAKSAIESLPPVEDMGEVSDGYHTFNQLYHQRAVLFATIVNQNKDKAWKSWKHEDGKFCFDKEGEWFIVGVDTPEGSYTYHYENKYWDMFDCEELDRGKHWDGHTEEDVTRLLSLPPVEPKRPRGEWVEFRRYCYDGTAYYWKKCSVCDHDMIGYETNFCPNCGADMRGDKE